jgi:hypothetical protein
VAVAARWASIAEIPSGDGNVIDLDNAQLRFVPITDGRPEGLSELDLAVRDPDVALAAADRRGVRTGDRTVTICGVRMNLLAG